MKFLYFTNYLLLILLLSFSVEVNAQCPIANSCTPGNGVDYGVGCGIFNVSLNTLNYSSGGVVDGYKDYSCTQGTSLIFGVNYNLSVQTGSVYPENVRIWIDYNNNGTFDVVNELAFSSDNKTLHTGIINIPSSAVLNQALRMRIASDYSSPVAAPCSTSQYSQTEDYKITVLSNTNPPTANFKSSDTLTCSGAAAFLDQSLNGPTSWKWYFGDGDSSSLQNPTHNYASGGYYSVTLIVQNSSGSNTSTKTNYIHYNTSVPVSATCTPLTSNYCCGYGISNVTFNGINNSSSNASEGYKDFTCVTNTTVKQGKKYAIAITTSGTNSQDTKVFIDYNNDGNFNITDEFVFQSNNTVNPSGMITIPGTVVLNTPLRMRVMSDYTGSTFDACTYPDKGQAEDYTITIIPNTSSPTIYFSVNNTFSCGNNFVFTDSSDNAPTSWLWNFGDGTTSTAQNPNHTYTSTGNYSVKLKACNSFGCDSLTKTNYINYSSTCAYCTSTGNTNSAVYINNVSFGTINNYSGIDANGYGNYTSTSTNVLTGNSYNLSISASSYSEYFSAWIDYNKDGVFSSSEQVIVSANSYGSYSTPITIPSSASPGTTRMRVLVSYYSAQANSPCGGGLTYGEVEDYSVNIVLNTQPPAPDFSSVNTVTCAAAVSFTDATTGIVTSRLWSFGDGTTSTLQNPTHTYSSYGTYTVKLKACNSYGCDSLTKVNYINYSSTCAYCTSTGNNNGSGDYINYVTFGTINNSSGVDPNGYGNYTSLSTNVLAGNSYSISIGTGSYSEYFSVWIDFNKDGTFGSTEQVVTSAYSSNPYSTSITIPSSASTGATRMRVLLSYYSSQANTPCGGNMTYGEVEDYTVNIVPNTQPPIPDFTSANTITCTGVVNFTDATTGTVTSRLWSFGDGTTSTVQNPSHTYSSYGTYTVKLKTCNSYGCDSVTKANFINYSAVCPYCTAKGTGSSYDYISYVGLNTISNSSSQSASGYGNYTSSSTNLTQGLNYTLNVYDGSYYSAYYNAWIDYNKDGVFSSSEQILNSYQYYSASASFTVPSTATPGTTRMRVILNTSYYSTSCATGISGEVEDYTINIVQNTAPPVTLFYSANTVTCSPSVTFTDTSTNVVTSWLWSFGDGTTSTLQNPTHTYSSYGTYTVKLKTCNSYGCDSLTKNNYINYSTVCPYCNASGVSYSSDYISYVGLNTISNYSSQSALGYGNYTSSSTNLTQGLNYTLDVYDGAYSGAYFNAWIDYNKDGIFSSSEQIQNSYQYYAASATFTVPSTATPGTTRMRVILNTSYYSTSCATGIDGEVEDYTINIVQNTAPPVTHFYSINTVTCSSSVAFTDTSSNLVTSWLWSFGDGTTSTLQNPTHTYSGYGTYTVKLKTCNSYGCDSLTKVNYINYSTTCGYCTSTANNNTAGDYISNVTFGTINNSSGVDPNGYGNYTSISTNVLKGSTYSISIGTSTYSEYFSVWIDYNKDGTFSSSEQVIVSAYSSNPYSTWITIPSSASTGATRMRVLVSYYSTQANTPCGGNMTYGEVEDYTVNIVSNTQPPLPDFTSANTVTCTGAVNFTDASMGTVTSRVWSFGDGTTSTLQNPSHTYSSYGTYTVKLKTCNSYGCDSVTKNNYISYSSICPICSASGYAYSSDYISYVGLNTITNYTIQSPTGYGNYTSVSTNLSQGGSYSIDVYDGVYSGAYFNAWIDYNHDNVFSSSEMILNDYQYYIASNYFTIPSTAMTGATRMRVILNTSYYSSPCATGFDGEVEDYTINILPSYCTISNNNNTTLWIDYVSMATLNNSSNQDPSGYGDYTSLITDLNPGATYNLDVEVGPYTYSKAYIVAWIDFNADGVFDNTTERFSSILINQNQNASLSIAVPSTCVIGLVNMRILATTNLSNSTNPCSSNMYYGEVEDYTINFDPVTGIQKGAVSQNSLTVSPNPNNGIFDVNINVTDPSDCRLQIVNTLGETVKDDVLPSGNSFTQSYDLSGLASGMYYVKLIIGQETVVIKKVVTQ